MFKVDPSKTAPASAGKGELLDLARSQVHHIFLAFSSWPDISWVFQLDIIGIETGHLPQSPPFALTLTSIKPLPPGTKITFENETLNTAANDREAFYKLYIAVTNRAIDLYAKSGRRKFALKLHGNLAALELYDIILVMSFILLTFCFSHRGNLSAALNTYTSLPAHYAPHMWTSLESFMLSRALDTYTKLEEMPQDTEWIHIVLSFLKTYAEHHDSEMLIHNVDKADYVSKLVNSLRLAVENLETGEH